MNHFDCDVIVVGAGLAGASAASELKARGLGVQIFEARDRPGGRGYFRHFGNTNEGLDFGGAWITPWQHRIRALCATHGVALRPRHPVTARRWFHDGRLDPDGPANAADRAAHDRALVQVARDSRALKAGETPPATQLSFASYLDHIAAPPATRELLSAWWTVSGNGDKTRVPASELLHSVGYHDGTPDGMCEVWADTLGGGVQTLCERMISAAGIPCRFGATVAGIAHGGDGVRITLAGGGHMNARAAILATGLNPMAGIAFQPALPAAKAASLADGHLGRCVKVWAKLDGIGPGVLATGSGRGIEWMFTERRANDGATLAVGFGVADAGWQPDFPADIEAAVSRFFPEARLVSWDWHDWNADPFARGAWVAAIAGKPEAHAAASWAPVGPLAFASSDFAAAEAGWFEAAIISGSEAAEAVARRLAIA